MYPRAGCPFRWNSTVYVWSQISLVSTGVLHRVVDWPTHLNYSISFRHMSDAWNGDLNGDLMRVLDIRIHNTVGWWARGKAYGMLVGQNTPICQDQAVLTLPSPKLTHHFRDCLIDVNVPIPRTGKWWGSIHAWNSCYQRRRKTSNPRAG